MVTITKQGNEHGACFVSIHVQVNTSGVLLTPLQSKSCLYPPPPSAKLNHARNAHTVGIKVFSYRAL